jgi:hypothetical protein
MGLVFELGNNVLFLGWKQIKGLQVWFKLINGLLCEINANECKYAPIWNGSEFMPKTILSSWIPILKIGT